MMGPRCLRTRWIPVATLLGVGCVRDVRVGRVSVDGERDGFPKDIAAVADGRDVTVDSTEGGACTRPCRPVREATVFHHAVCLRAGWPSIARLRTDGFDSRSGPYDPGRPSPTGSVATNGDLRGDTLDVGGALTVSGGVTAGVVRVRGRFHVGGDLTARRTEAGALAVGGSVRIEGDLVVRETFISPFGAELVVGGTRRTGHELRAAVSVPPACEPEDVVDLAARAAPIRQRNDDATLGLRVDTLSATDRPERLELSCGRYHFRGVSSGKPLVLGVRGHVEVLLDDDVNPTDLRVELAPDADIDVIVMGSFRPTGALRFGNATAPARARLYVYGGPTATLASGFAGLLYAPSLTVRVTGPVYGALHVNALLGDEVTVHYDTAALDAHGVCAVGACRACIDCPGRTCIERACAPCAGDGPCCPGLRCEAGQCVPWW